MVKKVTPAIERFIQSNCKLTPQAISGLIAKKFNVDISRVALIPYVERARAEAAADNNAKVEAVRAKILDSSDIRAEKYLKYLDDNVEKLHGLLINATEVKVEDIKDLVAVSNSLQKSLCAVLDFVKPTAPLVAVNMNVDLSKFTESELEEYGRLAAKLAGIQEGKSEEKPA